MIGSAVLDSSSASASFAPVSSILVGASGTYLDSSAAAAVSPPAIAAAVPPAIAAAIPRPDDFYSFLSSRLVA